MSIVQLCDHWKEELKCPLCLKTVSVDSLIVDEHQYEVARTEGKELEMLGEKQRKESLYVFGMGMAG